MIGVSTQEYSRRADFYDYFNLLDKPEGSIVLFSHDRSPAKSRNIIAEEALKYDCSHVLFIDDDMAFRSDALKQLIQHNVDIVTGLYLSRAYPHTPLIFEGEDDDGAFPIYLDESGLVPITAAGLGFILIKTDVFKVMEKPWVRLGELNPQEWCDDIGFFIRVRKAGFKMFCDTNCQLGHMGTMIIWPNKINDEWFAGYDTQGIGMNQSNARQMINVPLVNKSIEYEFQGK